MSNLWNTPGIPHRGWTLEDVYDVRADGESVDETNYEKCEMCGNEKIRFVHIVSHPDMNDQMRVGCVCSEKMTNDYVNPRRVEKELRKRATRRNNWTKKNWRTSQNGNYFLKTQGRFLLIYRDKRTGKFRFKIDEDFDRKYFDTLDKAKVAVFNKIEDDK